MFFDQSKSMFQIWNLILHAYLGADIVVRLNGRHSVLSISRLETTAVPFPPVDFLYCGHFRDSFIIWFAGKRSYMIYCCGDRPQTKSQTNTNSYDDTHPKEGQRNHPVLTR